MATVMATSTAAIDSTASIFRDLLIPQRDAQGLSGADHAAVGADGFEPADGVGDLDGGDLGALPGDHLAEVSGADQLDGVGAQQGTEGAVEGGWRAATLEV